MVRSAVVAVLTILTASLASAQLRMELSLDRSSAVQCEPMSLVISWQNMSETPLMLGELDPTKNGAVSLEIDGKSVTMPLLRTPAPLYLNCTETGLQPGVKKEGTIPLIALVLEPGTHKFKAEATFRGQEKTHFDGAVESDMARLMITAPEGEDLRALEYIRRDLHSKGLSGETLNLGTCQVLTQDPKVFGDILELFPDSIYAAWIVMSYFARPDVYEPRVVKEMLDSESWPLPNAVPGTRINAQRQLHGKARARWEIQWGERILTVHPDFARRETLRLELAVDYLILGRKKDGLRLLKQLASEGKPETQSRWAESFLGLYTKSR